MALLTSEVKTDVTFFLSCETHLSLISERPRAHARIVKISSSTTRLSESKESGGTKVKKERCPPGAEGTRG